MDVPVTAARLRDAIDSGDPQRVANCFASDYRCETPMHPARNFTGAERVLRNWAGIFASIRDLRASVLRAVVGGAETWSEWEITGTSVADGSPALIRGTVIWTEQHGVITWTRFYLEPVTDTVAEK